MVKKFDYSEIHPNKDIQHGRYDSRDSSTVERIKNIKMNSDGEPWKKCCKNVGDGVKVKNCAYIDRRITKSQTWQNRYPFVCVHRTEEDGTSRVCAGWHCCHGPKESDDGEQT